MDLQDSRGKLLMFLSGWLGGPDLFVEQFGHPPLRTPRHLPFAIGGAERDPWVAGMARAMEDAGIDPGIRQQLLVSFYNTADFMRNCEE